MSESIVSLEIKLERLKRGLHLIKQTQQFVLKFYSGDITVINGLDNLINRVAYELNSTAIEMRDFEE